MPNKNDLNNALETLKHIAILDTKTIDDILNTERMGERENKLWRYLRRVVVQSGTTIKIETMLMDDYILTNQWLDGFYDHFVEMITDMNKAVGRIPKLERDLKRLKKKKQQMKLMIAKKYETALNLITRQIEEAARAQQHYIK
jgi:hypothetical protein